ncbi:MAG: tetratricopeptide repeat protein [Rhodospirillales bacterium]|nr:MAG: tetratricopeptide repeat protein [Rhodospirillales bacterium]
MQFSMRRARLAAAFLTLMVATACSSWDTPGAGLENYDSLMRIGDGQRANDDPMGAVNVYRKAQALNPKSPDPPIRIGQSMLAAGGNAEAAAAFQEALKLKPGNGEALRGLGAALIAMDQPALALAQFDLATTMDPTDIRALNGAGVALDLLGRHAEAQGKYQAALERDQGYVSARNNLGLSQAVSGDYAAAIATLSPLTGAVGGAGGTPRTRGNLALAYGLQGDMANAARWLRADLDEPSVQRYLIYFGRLRSATPEVRTESIRANPEYFPRPAAARR